MLDFQHSINVICTHNSDIAYVLSHLFANRILFGLSCHYLTVFLPEKEAVESVYEEETSDCIKLPLFYC